MTTRLIRTDRNGTKYYESDECPRCGGTGLIDIYTHVEGGRCYKCGGSGKFYHSWKERTPEYQAKLDERRRQRLIAKAPEKNLEYYEHYNLDKDGNAWVVLGNTYEIKEELKEAGAKFDAVYGWHFNEPVDKYRCIKIGIEDVASKNEYGWYYNSDSAKVKALKEEATPVEESRSQYVGDIKERITRHVTLKNEFVFESYYGLHIIYKFVDDDDNVLVWKTTSIIGVEVGEQITLVGTVKDHQEYRGEKQTVLTRCKSKN